MRRKKELPLLEKIMITDIGAEGNALARVDNQVVFVPMLIPGDIVDIKVIKKRKNYMEGRAVRFHEYSADRVTPVCICHMIFNFTISRSRLATIFPGSGKSHCRQSTLYADRRRF
jgi:predicted RNA-binding protein with TRAM domain